MTLSPRNPKDYSAALDALKVETNPKFQKRDVTGDGVPETFCNQYVEAACTALGCFLPPGLLARQQLAWLQDPARSSPMGWLTCVNEGQAVRLARMGYPTVVGWVNPDETKSSHVAMVRPGLSIDGTRIAQAGARNYANAPLASGFGKLEPLLWFAHP